MIEKDTILVVDDSDLEAKLTMLALRGLEKTKQIIHLKDGSELIDFLTCKNKFEERSEELNKHIHFVLLDINMPRMSGLEALSIIRSNEGLARMPIIILSSSDLQSDLLDSYRNGANSFIKKPIEFELFRDIINRVVHYWLNINTAA